MSWVKPNYLTLPYVSQADIEGVKSWLHSSSLMSKVSTMQTHKMMAWLWLLSKKDLARITNRIHAVTDQGARLHGNLKFSCSLPWTFGFNLFKVILKSLWNRFEVIFKSSLSNSTNISMSFQSHHIVILRSF